MSDQVPPADPPADSVPAQDATAGDRAPVGTVKADASATGSPPPGETGPGKSRVRLTGDAIIEAIIYGSPTVITILAIFLALVVSALLIVFSDPGVLHAWAAFFNAPGTALSMTWTSIATAYSALFEGSIFSPSTISAAFHGGSIAAIFYPLSLTAFEATPLILTGLSVAIAFRAGLFNIGAAGQFVAGSMIAAWLGFAVHLPAGIHIAVCVIGGFVGGAALGWLVGMLKALTGAHEVIVTIMLNYVMYNLLSYLLGTQRGLQQPHQSNLVSPSIDNNAIFPHVGAPPLTFNTYGTYGFDGITVALLGRARPWGVVLAGLLFGALQAGGTAMQAATVPQVPVDIVEVIQGLIVLFVAAPPLIRAIFRLRAARETGLEAVAKGWNG